MCGRYMVVTEGEMIEVQAIFEELGKRLDRSGEPIRLESDEVFPGSVTSVIALDDNRAVVLPMMWGFKKWDNKGIIINARSETAADKPYFRDSLKVHRCIIPSKGFYEWKKRDGAANKKTGDKYLIRQEDSPFFFMAGIYRINDGVFEFTILTIPAAKQMQDIHDRMPLYLTNDKLIPWLTDPASVDMLAQRPNEDLQLMVARADTSRI